MNLQKYSDAIDLGGFSARNIKRIVRFYKEYEKVPAVVTQLENEKMPLLVAQIPWTHNTILIEKIKDIDLRYWYMKKIIENGWNKNIFEEITGKRV